MKAEDGTVLYGRLIKPSNFREGVKYPLIVYVYGGPGVQEIHNEWQTLDWQQVLADRGYLVWQLENRGSTGRGHAFEAPIYRELGKQEVADQRLGVEYLLSKGFVDRERIGITGWSYGGYMTIHCMLLAPDVFKVGVAGAPVNDWRNYDTIYTERYMDTPANNAARYDSASNVPNAAKLKRAASDRAQLRRRQCAVSEHHANGERAREGEQALRDADLSAEDAWCFGRASQTVIRGNDRVFRRAFEEGLAGDL